MSQNTASQIKTDQDWDHPRTVVWRLNKLKGKQRILNNAKKTEKHGHFHLWGLFKGHHGTERVTLGASFGISETKKCAFLNYRIIIVRDHNGVKETFFECVRSHLCTLSGTNIWLCADLAAPREVSVPILVSIILNLSICEKC